MTNKNISELVAAATPLAGTELVPAWDGTTKKVSVDNLTASSNVSMAADVKAGSNFHFPATYFV